MRDLEAGGRRVAEQESKTAHECLTKDMESAVDGSKEERSVSFTERARISGA